MFSITNKGKNRGGEGLIDLSKLVQGRQLSELDLQLLEFIINHIDHALQMGVREIAKRNYTSPATVVRLSKKLGYKGFTDMCYKLMPMIKEVKIPQQNEQIDFLEISQKDFFRYNRQEDIDSFIQNVLNIKEKYIFIYATGFSGIAAEYLYKKLLVLGKKAIFASGTDSIGVFESNLNDIGVLIVITRSGETEKVIEKLRIAKERKIYTVSFTNESTNRAAELSNLNFKIYDDYKLDDRNMLPNIFFPRLLAVIEFLIYEYFKLINRK